MPDNATRPEGNHGADAEDLEGVDINERIELEIEGDDD